MESNTKYHKMVWRRAKAETELYFRSDKKGWFGSVLTGVVSGIYTFYVSNIGGAMTSEFIGFVGVIMGTLLGWATFVIALYGYKGLWEVPAKMFIKKDKDASKYNWDFINITPDVFDEDSEFGFGLIFTNSKPYDIQNFSASLDFLMDVESKTPINIDKSYNRLPVVKEHNKTRTWSIKKLEREGGKRFVELILWNDFNVWFQTNQPAEQINQESDGFPRSLPDTRIHLSRPGAYTFVLSLSGQVDGYNLPLGRWEGRLLLLKNGVMEIKEKPKGE